ncbi:MAG: hypothetical protein JNG84_06565, partial [Archangium sp.]|nr:hypothetical protein [Archangium sp.]
TMRVQAELEKHHGVEFIFKIVWFGLVVDVLIEIPWGISYSNIWRVVDGGTLVEKKWPSHHGGGHHAEEEEHHAPPGGYESWGSE